MFKRKAINFSMSLITGAAVVSALAWFQTNEKVVADPSAPNGYSVSVFATSPEGSSQPDSVVVGGNRVFIGYGDGTASDGSDGKPSTVVEYTSTGKLVKTFTVPGHVDGLRMNPRTGRLFALLNQDGNPKLTIINPETGAQKTYSLPSINGGGGYDDLAFLNGKIFIDASNPTLDSNGVNTYPVLATLTIDNGQLKVTPVLTSSASFNITDPDSLDITPNGDLIIDGEGDQKQFLVSAPGTSQQKVSVLVSHPGITLDDTVFPPRVPSSLLVADTSANTIYKITGNFTPGEGYTASTNLGSIGILNQQNGTIDQFTTGFNSPHGLGFLPNILVKEKYDLKDFPEPFEDGNGEL